MHAKLLTLAALALCLSACDEDPGASDADAPELSRSVPLDLPQGRTIQGQVVDLFGAMEDLEGLEIEVVAVPRGRPVIVLGSTRTDERGIYVVTDLPQDVDGPQYVIVDDRDDELPAIATRVNERIVQDTDPFEPVVIDAWTADGGILKEVLEDLRYLDADVHVDNEGAILGMVLDDGMQAVQGAEVACNGCGRAWYLDPNASDGHFTHRVFDGAARKGDVRPEGVLNRATFSRAQGMFVLSGPEEAMLQASHPSDMAWPRYGVPTIPEVLTTVEMAALPPGCTGPEDLAL